jgi:hypothetical protein
VDGVVIRRLAVLIPLGLAAGCLSKVPAHRLADPRGVQVTRKVKATPRERAAERWRFWRDELGRYHTIGQLWNAINRHHDALGHALHPPYPTTRVGPYHRRVTPRRPVGLPPPDPPPPRIDRPPVVVRARAPLCRRACNHVRAICYAARRICQIARHLREYRALLTCQRARDRCADARRAARRRCRACD